MLHDLEVKFRDEDNYESAIEGLNVFFPDVVILDLRIFEKKALKDDPNRPEPSSDFGLMVFKEISTLNGNKQGSPIQVIISSANVKDKIARELAKTTPFVVTVVDKGSESFIDDLKAAVEKALRVIDQSKIEKPCEYVGFSKELKEELKNVEKHMYDHLCNRVLASFRNKEYSDTILSARQLLYCIRGGFSDPKFDSNKFLNDKSYPDDVAKTFDFLSDKGVRPVDVIFAKCLIDVRNKFKNDQNHKPTADDAAAVLQLMVPIVRAYINYRNSLRDSNRS